MFGAIIGDIVGSPYEFDWNNIKTKDFPLFCERSVFTDDTVMTLAIAQAIMDTQDTTDEELKQRFVRSMQQLGKAYPAAGYGARFNDWLYCDDPKPYGSFGNGSAMRVSAVAWMFDTYKEVARVAKLSAEVTHDHPEGIKGAVATASAIYMARTGRKKEEIRRFIEFEFGYDLSRSCDEIRPDYHHVESCQETVPEAIIAFLEGESFEDVLRLAVSLGGDSDTLTAIAASIAEAYYGIDENWKNEAYSRLPDDLRRILQRFDVMYRGSTACKVNLLHDAVCFAEKAHRGQKRKGSEMEYITHPMEVLQILTQMHAEQDLLIAGLLHDTVEDTPVTLGQIQYRFGTRVANLVRSHTEDKTKSWKERKQHTIDALKTAERDTQLLVLADKISNLRSTLADYEQQGEELWKRFNAPKELQSWYNSGVLDALSELQYDENVSDSYWEATSLYKELFVTYYADWDERVLYQTACGLKGYIFYPQDGCWTPFEGDVPQNAKALPRLKAERLEDLWRSELHDFTLDGNEAIEAAIAEYYADMTTEHMTAVLDRITERMRDDGHLIFPAMKIEDEDGFALRTVTTQSGQVAAAAFTSHRVMRNAPKSAAVSAFIDQVFSSICQNEDLDGILLNPWGEEFYLPKSVLRKLLSEQKRTIGKANRVSILQCDITQLDCECIVNAANKTLLGGGGVDGAIHAAAGPKLLEECIGLHGCETGQAKITKGYNLKAQYVIHTVGPVYHGKEKDATLLASCYRNSLELAKQNGIQSIAFPAISTGVYRYPLHEATQIAVDTVCRWLHENPFYGMEVVFSCYNNQALRVYQQIYDEMMA